MVMSDRICGACKYAFEKSMRVFFCVATAHEFSTQNHTGLRRDTLCKKRKVDKNENHKHAFEISQILHLFHDVIDAQLITCIFIIVG